MKKCAIILFWIIYSLQVPAQTFEKKYYGHYRYAVQSDDNSYLMTGQVPQNDSIDNISVLRVSAVNGSQQIQFIYELEGLDLFSNFIIETSDGGAFICGTLKTDSIHGDPIIFRIDACGNPVWFRNIQTLFCPDMDVQYLNWVNYAVPDGADGITFVIGLPCNDIYMINFNQYGDVAWASNDLGKDSWLMSGTSFGRLENGYYALTGRYHSYWLDEEMTEYKSNAALRILDSVGNFVSESVYYVNPDWSSGITVCDAWGSEGYMMVCDNGWDGHALLALDANADSLYLAPYFSIDETYIAKTRRILKGPKGLYYLSSETCDTIPMLRSALGAQLIDGNGNVLAQRSTDWEENYWLHNSFVTDDLKLVQLATFLNWAEDGYYSAYNTILMRYEQDLSLSIITDTIPPLAPLAAACGFDTLVLQFDLEEVVEDFYTLAITDTTPYIHENSYAATNISELNVNVFPNPASNKISFCWDQSIDLTAIVVYNINGALVRVFELDGVANEMVFFRGDLSSGLYTYTALTEDGRRTSGLFVIQ